MKLVEETIECVEENGHSESDIEWVGSKDGKYGMSWDLFKEAFERVKYNCGFGYQKVATDLVVVGNDWWLERYEYDGAEAWEFKSIPVAHKNQLPFDKILGVWNTLYEIQNDEEEK